MHRGQEEAARAARLQKPTDAQLKDQCEQEFDSLKQQVMQFLISAEWIQQEADSRDIEVTDEEVQKQFEDQKNQSFPNEKDYQQFLETSGQTEEDLLFRVKLDVLSNKVREEIIEGKGDISDEDIEDVLRGEQGALRAARAA